MRSADKPATDDRADPINVASFGWTGTPTTPPHERIPRMAHASVVWGGREGRGGPLNKARDGEQGACPCDARAPRPSLNPVVVRGSPGTRGRVTGGTDHEREVDDGEHVENLRNHAVRLQVRQELVAEVREARRPDLRATPTTHRRTQRGSTTVRHARSRRDHTAVGLANALDACGEPGRPPRRGDSPLRSFRVTLPRRGGARGRRGAARRSAWARDAPSCT